MSGMNEIEYLLKMRESLSDKTKKVYSNAYTKLRALLGKDISDASEEEISNAIFETDLTQSVKQNLLNIAIVVRQVYNKPIGELKKVRKVGSSELLVANVMKNETLKEDLPTLKELLVYTNSLYEKGEWRKYLVNYLILTFNVRNMDLNLRIVKTNKVVNNKDNWIVLHKGSADYLRYVYKTADTFDCKANTITSKNAVEAIKNLLGDKDSVYLLAKEDGERTSDSALNKMVSRMTLKTEKHKEGLGQANMLKVILGKKTDMKTFEKVSVNRGTSIEILNAHYNTNFTNEPKKMEDTKAKKNCMAKIPKGELGAEKKAEKRKTKKEELAKALE
jgi:hypothetical protein